MKTITSKEARTMKNKTNPLLPISTNVDNYIQISELSNFELYNEIVLMLEQHRRVVNRSLCKILTLIRTKARKEKKACKRGSIVRV